MLIKKEVKEKEDMDKNKIPESITIKVCWTETDEGVLFDEDSILFNDDEEVA